MPLLLAVTAAACGGEAGDTSRDGAADGAARAAPERAPKRAQPPRALKATPSVRIVAPPNGRTIRGGDVTVRVAVDGFELVRQRTHPPFPPARAGRGHVHFYLDTEALPTLHGPPRTGTYRSVSTTSYTWAGLTPGRHSLAVQLVGRDHAPLRPAAKDRITVDVSAG